MKYPLEWQEEARFHSILQVWGKPWSLGFHPSNEGAPSARQYAMGVVSGVPDHIIPVPTMGYFTTYKWMGLAIEFKRQRFAYGKSEPTWLKQISDSQRTKLEEFRELGWLAVVAFGADEALAIAGAYRIGRLELPLKKSFYYSFEELGNYGEMVRFHNAHAKKKERFVL